MDHALSGDDEFSPSQESESDEEVSLRRLSGRELSSPEQDREDDDEDNPSHTQKSLKPPVEARWDRLKEFYSNEYMTLFREIFADTSHEAKEFQTSQYGAVIWSPGEKEKFFKALVTCGKHNVHRIATQIATKSQVEVKAYLDLLKQAELDRQLFKKHTRNYPRVEIPAAVEVDVDYERGLDQYADALEAYQDRYDQAVGEKHSQRVIPWQITAEVARWLDRQTEEAQNASSDSEDPAAGNSRDGSAPFRFFRLSTFIELSEKIFMNGSKHRKYEHWSYCAEEGERPCMTSEVVEDFDNLIVNYLRRIVQTTIFLAQSRIRSLTKWDHTPANEVRLEDVSAMHQVLHIEGDLWSYWKRLPRRAQFRMVPSRHRQGYDTKASLSYDEVEAALSVQHHEDYLRSLSDASTSSRSSLSGSEDSDDSDVPSARISREGFSEYDEAPPLHISLRPALDQMTDRGGRRKEPEFDIEIEDASDSQYDDSDEEEDILENEDGSDIQHDDSHDEVNILEDEDEEPQPTPESNVEQPSRKRSSRPPMSSRKRRRIEEEGVEIYLQDLDVYHRVQEEHRLTQILGIGTPSGPVDDYAGLGQRPRVRRKRAEDVKMWQPSYQAAWECYGMHDLEQLGPRPEEHDVALKSVEQ